MVTIVQQCPFSDDEPDDICKRLAKEINDLINRDKRQCGDSGIHGLIYRFREQINGKNGPGTSVWETHDSAIREQQRGVRNRLNDFNKNNCGERVSVPQDAWYWATRPAPQPEEWNGISQRDTVVSEKKWYEWEYWEEITGLTGVALIVYLVVSEGSRLYPPRNLVPVP